MWTGNVDPRCKVELINPKLVSIPIQRGAPPPIKIKQVLFAFSPGSYSKYPFLFSEYHVDPLKKGSVWTLETQVFQDIA